MNYKSQLQELCQKKRYPLPQYTVEDRAGPSHRPVFAVRVTVTWGGERLEEVARGEGMKQKDVEKKAAELMLERISQMELQRGDPSSVRPVDPQQSPAASVKSELQQLLQKSSHNLPPPTYEDLPSTRRGEFTAKVTIRGQHGEALLQEYGYGKSKRESEVDAANKVLPKALDMLESRFLPLDNPSHKLKEYLSCKQSPHVPVTTTAHDLPPRPPDPEVDSGIEAQLCVFSPRYDTQEGRDNNMLCLARASCGVAAQGMAEDESKAMREAKLNLIHNLCQLGYL